MPYHADLNRANPTCSLFLIDQSSSMAEPFGARNEQSRLQESPTASIAC